MNRLGLITELGGLLVNVSVHEDTFPFAVTVCDPSAGKLDAYFVMLTLKLCGAFYRLACTSCPDMIPGVSIEVFG